MPSTRRHVLFAAAVVAGCTLLAGCTAEPADPEVLRPTATPAPTPTPTPTPTAQAACIVGAWTTGVAQLQPAYDSIPPELEYPRAVIDPAATVTLAFDALGTFTLDQNVPTTLEWEGFPAAVGLGGKMSGGYRTDGDGGASGSPIALQAQDNALTVVALDDRPASALFAAATQETLAQWPVSASGYTCDETTLVLSLATEGFPASLAFDRG